MKATFTSLEQLPLTLNADQLAQVLGISRANAYCLMHSQDFPTLKIGKRMVVPKDKLMTWMEKSAGLPGCGVRTPRASIE